MVIQPITDDPTLTRLVERLRRRGRAVCVSGLWGSSAPMVASIVAEATGRSLIYVTAHLEDADGARDDLELFGSRPCHLLPPWESLPGEESAGTEAGAERLRLCNLLHPPPDDPVTVVAPIQALMQPVPSREALVASTVRLAPGDRCDLAVLATWLADNGYERLERVESPGDFAVRGGILDLFIPGEADPVRVELLDDRVESIRRFDVSSQRSRETLSTIAVQVLGGGGGSPDVGSAAFFDYLPDDTVVALDEPAEIQELGETLRSRLEEPDALFAVNDVLSQPASLERMYIHRLGAQDGESPDSTFRFDVASLGRFEKEPAEALAELCRAAVDRAVYVVCDNQAERSRFTEMIVEQAGAVPRNLHMPIGLLHRGFEWTPARTICIGHHEIFHRYRQRRRLRRVHATRPLETWLDLEPGDLVVHVNHGIARFRGMKSIKKDVSGDGNEFLTLEFAERAELHVPVSQVDLVQKYIGAGQAKPRLSKLGGTRWRKTTDKVNEAVDDLAGSLLEIQAARQLREGTAYPDDTTWQREFEGSFLYEETEDQLIVADEVKKDLQSIKPMDRLLCGDVGYGKTELAIRAAFKVVEYGKQVAVLVPTTVLAEQHYQTFRERLADYPFAVRCLSRFRSNKEQKQIIEDARKGRVDILIGTHRLLSKDVGFADLGLAVIDEEQRFGVEHKNHLKQLRYTVDVLTMTATPIPRTLHMSMVGLRDISSLATPPLDRRAIATRIRPYDEGLIRSAILRELNRDGQVYFVHNYVRSINSMADDIQRIVPDARIMVGHGQMKEGELEKVMTAFVRHEADVLVSTTIIESGIDIPRVNTIFINNADRFGLADLHQLRGRVGRSQHRGYCYLLLPKSRTVTPKAARRLKSIEEFSQLGAGFQIAMRDLEIRGAGNVLGPEQSGHIAAVGYEMYCQILENAVRRLRGEPEIGGPRVQLELDITGHVPESYIPSQRSRLDVYKHIVSCRTIEELNQTERDVRDAFGRYPPPVERLIELAEIRIRAAHLGVSAIVLSPPDLVFTVRDHRQLEPVFARAPGTARMPDAKTVHWRPPKGYLEPQTLPVILRKYLSLNEEART